MISLTDPNYSYLIASSEDISGLTSYLYAKEYHVVEMKGYYEGKFENSVIGFTSFSPDELRMDCIHIMDYFNQDCIIIKYKGEKNAKKIFSDGSEKSLGLIMYNTDSQNKSYIHDGLSFSFVEKQLYYFPKKKSDFKRGMIVEYFNKDKWIKKQVINPETVYEKMYDLLIKFNKIRVAI
jgi:hypothetical protein